MSQKVRFEDMQTKVYIDDREFGPWLIVDHRDGSDMRTEKTKYQGWVEPFIDATDQGFTMSLTCELVQGVASPDDAMDYFRQQVLRRTGLGNIRAVVSYVVPGESGRKGHRYQGGSMNIERSSRSDGPLQWTVRFDMSTREVL